MSLFSQSYSDFLGEIQSYQDKVAIKSLDEKDIIDPETFDAETYFEFFENIQFSKNRIYGVHYQDNFFDGKPYLYSIKSSSNNFHLNDSTEFARYNIKPEDSELGYIEYLFFCEFGDQFALKWHANFNEKFVLFNDSCMDNIIKEYLDNDIFIVDKQSLLQLKETDPMPVVKLEESSCIITWIEIQTHYGIYKKTYSISRKKPYTVTLLDSRLILPIQAGILY